MILSYLLIARMSLLAPVESAEPLWKPLPNISALVDRIDKPGVVATTTDNRALVFDSDGHQVANLPIKDNSSPLFYGRNGLIAIPPIGPIGGESGANGFYLRYSAQGSALVCISAGAVVQTADSVFARPTFDRFSAIGVRQDGREICVMERPMTPPILSRFTLSDDQWASAGAAISPEVEGAGFASVIPRFNDLRYVSDHRVVFIGGLIPVGGTPISTAEFEKRIRNASPPLAMERFSGSSYRAYLFLTDLRSRMTVPAMRLDINGSGESGSARFGRISVSSDEKWLFVCCRDGIQRVSTHDLNVSLP